MQLPSWNRVSDIIIFVDISNFMMTSDENGFLIQNPWTTKDRKVADPSNESSCKAVFLKKGKEKQWLGNISLLFLLISVIYDVSNIFLFIYI